MTCPHQTFKDYCKAQADLYAIVRRIAGRDINDQSTPMAAALKTAPCNLVQEFFSLQNKRDKAQSAYINSDAYKRGEI